LAPPEPALPVAYPSTRREIAESLRRPLWSLWLRLVARVMEWLTRLRPAELNYSDITPQLAVGGSFGSRQIGELKRRGVTAVVDCRREAKDDPAALARAGMAFLHLPAPDRYALSYEQLRDGVRWVRDHIRGGGHAYLHCEHGVGRGPLMACAVLVSEGYSAPEALRLVRAGRWQAMPNDRQLAALVEFERRWLSERAAPTGSPPAG
jgi:Dual specificity phosphatase, catalytic domain